MVDVFPVVEGSVVVLVVFSSPARSSSSRSKTESRVSSRSPSDFEPDPSFGP